MVSWYADGGVSGYSNVANTTNIVEDAIPGLERDMIKLASNGSVDAQGITRLYRQIGKPNFRDSIDVIARLRFTPAEIAAAQAAGRQIGATVVFSDASNFPAGVIPTPTQILAAAAGSGFYINHTASNGVANTNYELSIQGYRPGPNKKVWVLVYPSTFTVGSVTFDDQPVGNVDFNGRAVSMWTNRTPSAPVITSPPANSVYGSGAQFDLTYKPSDPDAFGLTGSATTDTAGVQVQYRAKPNPGDPNPPWADMPITDTVGTPGNGWYIDRSINNFPASDAVNGAFYFWANQTMKVKGGALVGASPTKTGLLPSGDWQIRLRTFDYGHPYPRWWKPLNAQTGNTSPNTYDAVDASPWSTPVNITVSSQVPPPVPLSPIDSLAYPLGTIPTLRWRYRNSATPPYAQKNRTVQIRKAGETVWTTLVSGNSASTEYPLNSPSPPIPPTPVEYAVDGGFENNTLGNWLTTANQPLFNQVGNPPTVHAGTHALGLNNTTTISPLIYQFINLQAGHEFFSIDMWLKRGNAEGQLLTVAFTDAANTQLSTHVVQMGSDLGWQRAKIDDMPRPATATKVLLQITSVKTSGTLSGVFMDDFSFLGSSQPPSTPIPVYNPYTLEATTQYEWRVKVIDAGNVESDWSAIARFWIVPAGNSGPVAPLPSNTIDGATLGCGTHRAFIYRRGGVERVGEVKALSYVDWGRLRDDISDAKVIVEDWDIDCGNLLAKLQTWAYELVIFRDNGYGSERVWEGPITLLTYESDKVTIQAKDVMAYAYRRIIKQAMNDSGNSPTKGDSVVSRAARVLRNVLAVDDPNVLAYLQIISQDDDAKQYRNLPAWSRSAYEEIDDMAANAGLDYVAVGRAVLLWGTKHRIGTLPEFRDENLGTAPIVSEYGMSMSNVYAVSDGNGVYGTADRLNNDDVDPIYGLVEVMSSSWASDSEEDAGTYTQEGLETVRESFAEFAERSIADRYPPPVVVRVPDNTTLNPNTVLSIQHLIPGVVIPLRSTSTLRTVASNQKLDSVKVVETKGNETISITLSPFSRDDTAGEGEVPA